MKITIKDKDIELKNKLRNILIYEQITGKAFNPTTMTDMMVYMYSTILACEPTFDTAFNDFVDILDENPKLFADFNDWLLQTNKINEQMKEETEDTQKKLS